MLHKPPFLRKLCALLPLLLACLLVACGGGDASKNAAAPGAGAGTGNSTGTSPVTVPDGSGSGSGSGSSTVAPPVTPDPNVLALPIEVLGTGAPDAPLIAATSLALDANAVAQAATLVVLCHRCGFYNAPEFEALSKPLTKVAGSLRIIGAASAGSATGVPWIDISDTGVTVGEIERAHGGISGGMLTVRFSVPLDAATRARLAAAPASNRIEFRFNGTDGNSNGYRILDLQVQDATGKDLLAMTRTWADIGAEKTAGRSAAAADVDQGKTLWSAQNQLLKSSIVATKLRAACASCHASDGSDLQYFNYSNNAIVKRALFHGLSEVQGKQIVAYLRSSLADKVTHVAAATPWNPPYQPGPGLDAKPINEWAAGAGLAAVLTDAKSVLNVFVGRAAGSTAAVTQADMDAAMDPSPGKEMNTREMPVALQMPDWNAWLPVIHPLDVWTPETGQTAGAYETFGDAGTNPGRIFQSDMDWLQANKNPNGSYGDWSHLTDAQREYAQYKLNDLGKYTIAFTGGNRGDRVSSDPAKPYGSEIGGLKLQARMAAATAAAANMPAAFTTAAFNERAVFSMFHWMGVKQWELAHTHGLEGQHGWFTGSRDATTGKWTGVGEKRGWPFGWPSLFYLAPHMEFAPAPGRDNYFSWETPLISGYRTNQWYQMQMTVSPGSPSGSSAMDWPYHELFTAGIVDQLNAAGASAAIQAPHLLRYIQLRTKLAQLTNTNVPFSLPDPTQPNNLFLNAGIRSKADLVNQKLGFGELTDRGPADDEQTRFRRLDKVIPGLFLISLNSSIYQYNQLYASTTYAQWRRCDPNASFSGDPVNDPEALSGFRFCLDPARIPLPLNSNGQQHLPGDWYNWTTEQYITWSIISAKNHGAEAQRLKTVTDWSNRMWP